MWFPSDMAVLDFTVRITRFGAAERVRPLVHAIIETFDRLGVDHLLVDVNRDGEAAWSGAYPTDPVVISGSAPLGCGLDDRIAEVAKALLPEGEVTVDWFARDANNRAAMRAGRTIERLARMFGSLSRGLVPARVRLAVLNPEIYVTQYGDHGVGDYQDNRQGFYLEVLYAALAAAGAELGVDWGCRRATTIAALANLRATVQTQQDHDVSDSWRPVRPCSMEDELDFLSETADYLNAAMFEAISEALVPPRPAVPVMADAASAGAEPWIA